MPGRRAALTLPALLLTGGAAAGRAPGGADPAPGDPPFRFTATDRLRPVAREYGWTVLRDRMGTEGETGLVLLRVQRPVPPAARRGHLAALLRSLRAFRFDMQLPAEEAVQHASGLPAAMLTAQGMRTEIRLQVRVRALILYGPSRSLLGVASAPVAMWEALAPEIDAVLTSLRLA